MAERVRNCSDGSVRAHSHMSMQVNRKCHFITVTLTLFSSPWKLQKNKCYQWVLRNLICLFRQIEIFRDMIVCLFFFLSIYIAQCVNVSLKSQNEEETSIQVLNLSRQIRLKRQKSLACTMDVNCEREWDDNPCSMCWWIEREKKWQKNRLNRI